MPGTPLMVVRRVAPGTYAAQGDGGVGVRAFVGLEVAAPCPLGLSAQPGSSTAMVASTQSSSAREVRGNCMTFLLSMGRADAGDSEGGTGGLAAMNLGHPA